MTGPANSTGSAHELLELFSRHAVGLEVRDGKLKCTAPKGFLTPDRLAELRRHKDQLIAILTGQRPGDRIPRRPVSDAPLPLSSSQRQLWYLDQLSPGNPFYNNPSAFEISGELDRAALGAAVDEVVRRHESLRTVFGLADGEPCQLVQPAAPVPMPLVDLSGLPAGERAERARQLTEADAQAPFDLRNGPLLRTSLLDLGDGEYRWLVNVHHIVADGWSIGILVHEVGELYAAHLSGRPAPLPEPPVQYPDYALWQRERLSAGNTGDLDYWTAELAGAPTLLALPTDRPRPATQRFRGERLTVTAGADTLRNLRAVSRDGNATLFMTLMASLSVLLWRYSGCDDVCVGTPFANRNSSEVEDLIGHFINTVVVRTRVAGGQSFAELLSAVRDTVLRAYAHADQPFEQLVEALHPERHASYSPLFQVMLVLQNMPLGELELPGLALRPAETGTGAARFDLSLEVTERAGELELSFEYDSDLFDAATVARMAGHYVRLLEQLGADPRQPVGGVSLLGAAEREHELFGCNATAQPLTGPADLVRRFQAAAAAHPDQPAVVSGADRLDYAGLQRRANRLAAALIERGVRPDELVGLHTGRSVELAVGILAILQAGAGYLPLDPSLPAERLAGMVADARPALVLSTLADAPAGWLPLAAVEAEGRTEDAPGVAVRRRQSGLHDLHLRLHRTAQGGGGQPCQHRQPARPLAGTPGPAGSGRQCSAALWSSIGFDVSVQEILLPLTTGATLHLVPEQLRADPEALMGWLREHRIVQAYLPPAFVHWIDEAPAERLAGLALRQLLVGVEPLPELALHRMTEALPGLRDPQRLRPHRDLGLQHRLPRPAAAGPAVPDRPAAGQHPDLPAGRAAAAGAGRGGGRDLHRRRRGGPRLPGPARPDRRAVRPGPVRGRRADVSHRRPGPPAARRHYQLRRAGATTRSSCAASGSSSARSRRCCASSPGCARRPCCSTPAAASRGWWPRWPAARRRPTSRPSGARRCRGSCPAT